MALQNITYYPIFGKPLIMWLGIATLLSLLATAAIPLLRRRGFQKFHIRYHFILARVTIGLALVHGFLGVAIYF